jgi:hypothetical protein
MASSTALALFHLKLTKNFWKCGNKTAYGDTTKGKSETFGFFFQFRSGEAVVEDCKC